MSYKICFCSDRKYIKHVSQVVRSILVNSSGQFEFYLITDSDAVDEAKSLLDMENLKTDIHVLSIDTSIYSGLKEIAHFTKGMYYRLSIPELIQSERVLYLDCDITVNGDLEGLFKTDIDNYYIAAVENPFFYRYASLGMKRDFGYFNSGMMLINTKAWLENNIKDRVIEYVKKNDEYLVSPDQDALNAVFEGKWKKLPITYNAQSSMYKKIFAMRKQNSNQLSQLLDPKIIHYSSSSKPWMTSDAHALKHIYQKYSSLSESSKNGKLWDISYYLFNIYRDRISFLIWKLIFIK
jgi:lipopolysaccharide biosynthesis glycosyltransferase